MTTPLVSCIMATRNRQRFLAHAISGFLRQTYPNKELVVIDDSDRSAKRLCSGIAGVKYLRLTRETYTGTKLNLGIGAARGDILQKLDDDDIYAPDFLESSVRRLPKRGRSSTLVTRCCFLVLLRGESTLRHSGHGWTPGGAFCFWREMWKRRPFRDLPRSEDAWFLEDHTPRIVRICRAEEYIVVRHGANTWNAVSAGDADDYFRSRGTAVGLSVEDFVPPESVGFWSAVAAGRARDHRKTSSRETCQIPRP